jgi:hypothetical protein
MDQKKKRTASKFIFLVSIFLIFFSLLSACTNQQDAKPVPSNDNQKPNVSPTPTSEDWKLPITIPEGELYKIGGWISDNQVVYITNLEQSSNIYLYNLLKGESDLLYKSEEPIVAVQISPERKYILIQSSPSTYEGTITIIDPSGTEIIRQSFESFELAFEWNPYNESELLVSSFNEDWSYQMHLLDIKDNIKTEINLPYPFNKWIGQEEVAFLKWDENTPSFFAPLLKKKLGSEEEKEVFPSVFHFTTFRNLLMAITVNEQDTSQATYSFYNKGFESVFSFSVPHLEMFSGWLVPFYDYNEKKGQFITFKPLKTTEVDSYFDRFELISYDLETGSNKVILDGMNNEPVSFSPSGEQILYGTRFEKIINLKTKKVYELIKE